MGKAADVNREGKPLTPHQKRVLGALLAIESAHGWRWWSRDAIGRIIDAGGFHGTIQKSTISILKHRGLVLTERSSWPEEFAAKIRCHCACHYWGLTEEGKQLAETLKIHWSPEAEKRVSGFDYDHCHWWRDEDERPPGWDNLDDDDDDDGTRRPSPSPLVPALA